MSKTSMFIVTFFMFLFNLRLLSLGSFNQEHKEAQEFEQLQKNAFNGDIPSLKKLGEKDESDTYYMVQYFIRLLQDAYCYNNDVQNKQHNKSFLKNTWKRLNNLIAMDYDRFREAISQFPQTPKGPLVKEFNEDKSQLQSKDKWQFIRQAVLNYIGNAFRSDDVFTTKNLENIYNIHHPKVLDLIKD